ncbi:hypothetical protein BDW02DRAFT_570051 [Decorospora gaudefroyi]|uniref:Uncharacterized protein n=1 Tax=Decorospora gaudefroyi TaxID=184978 RepID=A0A6A5KDC5_9PLEO|nr:hypothetical protein BDW02DRAFT_570051 [Decorospora gaudefroyi]
MASNATVTTLAASHTDNERLPILGMSVVSLLLVGIYKLLVGIYKLLKGLYLGLDEDLREVIPVAYICYISFNIKLWLKIGFWTTLLWMLFHIYHHMTESPEVPVKGLAKDFIIIYISVVALVAIANSLCWLYPCTTRAISNDVRRIKDLTRALHPEYIRIEVATKRIWNDPRLPEILVGTIASGNISDSWVAAIFAFDASNHCHILERTDRVCLWRCRALDELERKLKLLLSERKTEDERQRQMRKYDWHIHKQYPTCA